jgi:parvulin-like peptidyl-prolyl isomerase
MSRTFPSTTRVSILPEASFRADPAAASGPAVKDCKDVSKNLRRLGVAIAALPLMATLAWAAVPPSPTLVNQIILRVNSRIATLEDYQRTFAERRQGILAADIDAEARQRHLEESGRIVFRDLFEELLLLSRADQLGLRVSEAELEQMRRRMGLESEEDFRQALAVSGVTEAEVRQRLERNQLIQQVVGREVQSRVELEDEELRRVYRQNPELFTMPPSIQVQEIIVLSEAIPRQEDRHRVAREILSELAAGTSLEEVATSRSAAGQTTGLVELGWVERGDLSAELETMAWELEAGQTSEPFEARGGTHILQVVDRREESLRPFEEIREQLMMWEMDRRMAEELPRYLEELASRAYVVMRVPPEAEGFQRFERRADEEPTLEESLGLGGG